MSKYATTSLPEQYRKFKKKDSSFLYAFAFGEFYSFIQKDAREVNALFPDMLLEKSATGYYSLRVHSSQFIQFVHRLVLKKKKVLTVERIPSPGGKVGYCIREKFEKEDAQ